MTEKEACILSDVPYDSFLEAKEKSEAIRTLIEKRKVEFKFNHIEAIQTKKTDRNSMYLLEKLIPEEFGPRGRTGDGPTINIISAIIKDIQNDPSNNIVRFDRAQRIEADTERRVEGAGLLN
jgi:hypothetical protein